MGTDRFFSPRGATKRRERTVFSSRYIARREAAIWRPGYRDVFPSVLISASYTQLSGATAMRYTVFNVMFGRGLGGIEQAWADYSAMLVSENFNVVNVSHRFAVMPPQAGAIDVRMAPIANWDMLAVWRLHRLLKKVCPRVVVCHGNRALNLLSAAGARPLIFVAHNYNLQHVHKAHAVFTITEDLRRSVLGRGVDPGLVRVIPNSIDVGRMCASGGGRASDAAIGPEAFGRDQAGGYARRGPLVIGAMGRMVAKKGFAELIVALAMLRDARANFRAVIGGEGEEASALAALAKRLGLEETITFPGWIRDKEAFFRSIDIFCLPSVHEPFGIVALEAMAAGLPIVSTVTEGPREILGDEVTALLAPPSNPWALAEKLHNLLADACLRRRLAEAARRHVESRFDQARVAGSLAQAVHEAMALRR